jgi:uncharacterized protein YeeX (DUF496 family)
MSSYKQSRKCSEYVFSNLKFLTLLDDIKNWFESNNSSLEKVEACMETMTVEYNEEKNEYVACVYLADY